MKLGTHIKLPDGRVGTVVYNGLDGVGIKWGRHAPKPEDFEGTTGGLFDDTEGLKARGLWPFPWLPDAMLREPYKYADLPCVGNDYELLEE